MCKTRSTYTSNNITKQTFVALCALTINKKMKYSMPSYIERWTEQIYQNESQISLDYISLLIHSSYNTYDTTKQIQENEVTTNV